MNEEPVARSCRWQQRKDQEADQQSLFQDAQPPMAERQITHSGGGKWRRAVLLARLAAHRVQTSDVRSLRAFAITDTELKLMAAAAMTGLSSNPKKG